MTVLDGAGPPVVRVASAACCWCGSAAGVGGAEVDGSGDVEALVAVVARDRGGGVVMVAVVLQGEYDEPLSRVPLAIILASAALPYVPGCGGGTCGCRVRCISDSRLRGGGMPLHVR